MFGLRVLASFLKKRSRSCHPLSETSSLQLNFSRKSTNSSTCAATNINNNQEVDVVTCNDNNPDVECAATYVKSQEADSILSDSIDPSPVKKHIKAKRYALLLSYLGANYYGMQYQKKLPTIEGELFQALLQAEYITQEEKDDFRWSLYYNRTSRTDSRVSALRQVVNLNFREEPNVEKINQFLPSDIRVLAAKQTTKNFDGQKQCTHRSYCYILPSFALCEFWKMPKFKRDYRINADSLCKANDVFQFFEGTHSFHNYTEKRDHWDPRSKRTIIYTSVSDAYLVDDMELVELHLKGTSFMLHQIRRMVGMLISVMRGKVAPSALQESLINPLMPCPTAPALGLMLEAQHFDVYNRKFGHVREPLTWEEWDDEVEKFKLQHVVPHIVRTEKIENVMEFFIDGKLRRHGFIYGPTPYPKIVSLDSNLSQVNEGDTEKVVG